LSLGNLGNSLFLTGSSDKSATLFNSTDESIVAKMTGHKKKVTGAILHPAEGTDVAITCSADKTVKIWEASKGTESYSIGAHTGEVSGISLHPLGDYVLSVSADQHWGFHSLETGKTLAYCTDAQIGSGYGCAQIHPDGKIFGAGLTNNTVSIWDIRNQNFISTLEGHTGAVTSISFSENGKYFATGSADSTVKIWDLRKFGDGKKMQIAEIVTDEDNSINSVAFDHSGNYLAVGGKDVRVYQLLKKTFSDVTTLGAHSKKVTSVAFGLNAKTLYSASMDRSVKVFA
jgi:pre-mRNA-processing factor 19